MTRPSLAFCTAAAVLLVAGTYAVSSTYVPPPPPTGAPADPSILQLAVNGYASIGQSATCANYVTQDQGGTIYEPICVVNGTAHDANLVVQMSGEQLAAELKTGAGPSKPILSDINLAAIGPTISTPTSTTYTPLTTPASDPSPSTTSSSSHSSMPSLSSIASGTGMACAAAGGVVSILMGGGATELTQGCNHVQLTIQAAVQAKHLLAYQQSLKGLSIRTGIDVYGVQRLPTSVLRDIKGEALAIGRVINGFGGEPGQAWGRGMVPLSATYLTRLPSGAPDLANAASISMTDAFSGDALQAIGDHRAREQQTSQAIDALQSKADSTADDDNTPVAQANLTNAALLALLKVQQSNAVMHAAILQQLTVQNTWQRNAVAATSNTVDRSLALQSDNPLGLRGSANIVGIYVQP